MDVEGGVAQPGEVDQGHYAGEPEDRDPEAFAMKMLVEPFKVSAL